jgi:hypothetical protein
MTDIEWTIVLVVVLCLCGIGWKMAERDKVRIHGWRDVIDPDASRARQLMAEIVRAKRQKKRRSHLEAELRAIRVRQLERSVRA